MMKNKKNHSFWISLCDDGLRTKFRPKTGISSIFLHVVPWINLVALTVLFLIVSNKITLNPSISFALPHGTFAEGTPNTLNLVMLRPADTNEMPLIFFDDVRYRMNNPTELDNLSTAITSFAQKPGTRQLLLLADGDIRHSDIIKIVDIARNSGINQINVGIKPE